jgi:glycosyltransferase involved in cell wall biosynthesis
VQAARLLYRSYDVVVCVSNKLRGEVKSTLGVDCRVIPLPMKLDLYKPASPEERENIVVHIGARPVKNPQISIETIKILRRRGYNVKLVTVGAPSGIPSDEAVEFTSGLRESEKFRIIMQSQGPNIAVKLRDIIIRYAGGHGVWNARRSLKRRTRRSRY